ncbi:MAG: RNase Irp1 base non-specific acid ribonuclease [Linnemannia elongata]|nr:MAG: RNase Irp1 base non-specific acid ribonuclease [Linnemannia elongata]
MKFMSITASLAIASLSIVSATLSGCSTDKPASCKNTTIMSDLCCFESPGGLLVQTQFWETGPADSFTIYGLWPDRCDATIAQYCDASRAYTNINGLLLANGASDTLAFMQQFWLDLDGQNEQFWENEWAKSGTCMSTLQRSCFPSGSPKGIEAVTYFQSVVKLFQTLPTYTFLANEGITPDSTKTYSLSSLTSALQSQSGFIPALDCTSNALNGIRWYFNLKGSVIDGTFIPINAPIAGSCPSSGIKYSPKV